MSRRTRIPGVRRLAIGATVPDGMLGAGGIARINLIDDGYMRVLGNTGITISAFGRIDIEDGYLQVLGDFRTQLSTYISQGRITAYNGTGTVNTPTYSSGYTSVTTNP